MPKQENQEITRDEIKKEFQLERMILFSDAVFAIVITLMAIEIKLPETDSLHKLDEQPGILIQIAPALIAYCVSFFFIGAIWYQHLKIFSLLKDYDKGLVIRNLLLLFFIGLFPFSATMVTMAKNNIFAFYIYLGIILICILAQYILHHYILVKKPELRVNVNIDDHLLDLQKRKISLICFIVTICLIIITRFFIIDPQLKPLATLWMIAFPIVYRFIISKKVRLKAA